ncbi:DUF2934 domain-containing protein [Methylobacterium oryzisoli]|uniref:DUF2934 domain-containing protein n=1 Tax=Methylobacterium oryzisoli TaxID=3385502 RepID=UPI003891D771
MRAPDEITFEQIRERAYDLWERNHRPHGFEIEFWLMAERELKAERNRNLTLVSTDTVKSLPAISEVQGQK